MISRLLDFLDRLADDGSTVAARSPIVIGPAQRDCQTTRASGLG